MLTYILGAGASYQSIPIVNTFPKRFKQFVNELFSFYTNDLNSKTSIKNFEIAYQIGKVLGESFDNHQSFDTYFKKLFHTNELELIKKYKKLLNLYFIWEHLQKVSISETSEGISSKKFFKESKIDKRYDALIAGLLQPIAGEKKMFCKINFITWNYDLNLLSSIKNYFYPNTTYKIFLEEIGYQNPVWNINDQISIINMNGFFYSNEFDDRVDIYHLDPYLLLKERMVENYFDDDYIAEDAELIKFAWETESANTKPQFAKMLMKESDNVVVIGYTFPLYNRLIDSVYLDSDVIYNITNNLFVQDPNSKNVATDFISVFKLIPNYIKILTKIDCNQFFVPNDIIKEEKKLSILN